MSLQITTNLFGVINICLWWNSSILLGVISFWIIVPPSMGQMGVTDFLGEYKNNINYAQAAVKTSCSQASWEIWSLQQVLVLPWGLLPVAHARNTLPRRQPAGTSSVTSTGFFRWEGIAALLRTSQITKHLILSLRESPETGWSKKLPPLVYTYLFFWSLSRTHDHEMGTRNDR